MALLFFIENEPPLPEVLHRASGFFIPNLVKRSQALVKCSEKPNCCEVIVRFCEVIVRLNCSKLLWNRAIISSLMYQGLDYQITDVIQLNRAKFIFNRSKKKTRMLRQ